MTKFLRIGLIALPLVLFVAIFGERIMIVFILNENDQIDAQNSMTETLVGGQGWTDPNGWVVEE